jgi:hypothetical protein
MTPDELVEKMAREISRGCCDGCECDGYIEPCSVATCSCRASARAALRVVREAMQEPDEAMVIEGGLYAPGVCLAETRRDVPAIWRAMLAASPIGRIDA